MVAIAVAASVLAFVVRIGDVFGGSTYTESLVTMERPMVLDPLFARADPAVSDVAALTYRGLMKLDDQAAPVPDLASSVQVSRDGLSYTIQLSRASWSDGRLVSAEDVVKTIHEIAAPAYEDASLAAAWTGVALSASGQTLTITLRSPRASFEATLAQTPILPLASMSASQLAALPGQDALALPTSGPYQIASTDANTLTLSVNKNFTPAPKLHTIKFHLFSTFSDALSDYRNGGDAIVARTPAERAQLLATHLGRVTDVDTFQFDDLVINERVAGLNDPVVRSAISQLVNRDAIVNQALQGQAVAQSTAIPAGIIWAQPRSAAATGGQGSAESSLAADGWIRGPDGRLSRFGEQLRFQISVPAVPALQKTGGLIANSLNAAGFSVSVITVPQKNFVNQVLNTGDFNLAVVEWANGPDPDVSEFWRSNATPPKGLNVSGGAPDVFLDQALDSLATVSDRSGRRTAAAAVASDLNSDVPAVFLDTPTVTVGLASGLKGVNIPATGGSGARFSSVEEWSR